jgi:hypothetical protein
MKTYLIFFLFVMVHAKVSISEFGMGDDDDDDDDYIRTVGTEKKLIWSEISQAVPFSQVADLPKVVPNSIFTGDDDDTTPGHLGAGEIAKPWLFLLGIMLIVYLA